MSDTLIISVSGVRGHVGKDLTPEFTARFCAAFGTLVGSDGGKVVLGRDARTSGPMLAAAATAGLQSVGCNVIDVGMVPTPTVELEVEHHEADGGIILTASHNPIEWNALKFVGPDGLFLDADTGTRLRELFESGDFRRASWDGIGTLTRDDGAVARHLAHVLSLDYIDQDAISGANFKVVLDCVRGAGSVIMPSLLERLGCDVVVINGEADGRFPRSPEPTPENLKELGDAVKEHKANIGLAVDPDVDRLAVVDENGVPIGEDYTLAFAVETVLDRKPGPVVVNLSTSRAVDDAAALFGIEVTRAPVGEANVARAMIDRGAVVGGEGNGGVMLTDLHIGRDAPLAACLVLDLLARRGMSVSELVDRNPRYSIIKSKAPRSDDLDALYEALKAKFSDATVDTQDGLHLSWADSWLHVRPSGTEPIVRLIAEAPSEERAQDLVDQASAALGEKV